MKKIFVAAGGLLILLAATLVLTWNAQPQKVADASPKTAPAGPAVVEPVAACAWLSSEEVLAEPASLEVSYEKVRLVPFRSKAEARSEVTVVTTPGCLSASPAQNARSMEQVILLPAAPEPVDHNVVAQQACGPQLQVVNTGPEIQDQPFFSPIHLLLDTLFEHDTPEPRPAQPAIPSV